MQGSRSICTPTASSKPRRIVDHLLGKDRVDIGHRLGDCPHELRTWKGCGGNAHRDNKDDHRSQDALKVGLQIVEAVLSSGTVQRDR